jgi:hypothetical protein
MLETEAQLLNFSVEAKDARAPSSSAGGLLQKA